MTATVVAIFITTTPSQKELGIPLKSIHIEPSKSVFTGNLDFYGRIYNRIIHRIFQVQKMILRPRYQIRTYFYQFFGALHIYFIFVLDIDTRRSCRISNGIKMGMSGIIQVNQSRRYDFDIPNPRIKSPIHICSRAIIQIIIRFPSEGHSTLVTVKMTYRKFFGTSPFRQLGGCIQGTTIPNILIPVVCARKRRRAWSWVCCPKVSACRRPSWRRSLP